MPVLLFQWWYGLAYHRIFKYIRAVYIYTADLFSIKIIFVTLFAPWKRDVISYEGLTLQQKFEVWSLNMASRFIGFAIKVVALAVYLIFTIFETAASFALIIIWPFYPFASIGLIYYGISLLI